MTRHVFWQDGRVSKAGRAEAMRQRPHCIWLTGLSGAGKSTLAYALEAELHRLGRFVYVLDGDNVRHGLNSDLGFSREARRENIRRVGEVARLMVDAGLIVIVAFISPFRYERALARALFEPGEFVEVYVDAALSVCEQRDTKGLYAQARKGALPDFTGIDSPYEAPDSPELHLRTDHMALPDCLVQICSFLDAGRLT